jgi:hypothetical protein
MTRTIREYATDTVGLAKRHPLASAATGLSLVVALGLGISAATAKGVDLVDGVRPMSASMASISSDIDHLATIPEARRAAYIQATWPHLATDVTYFLRSNGQIPANVQVTSVQFRYGDLDRINAQEAGGRMRRGFVRDQLIAVIKLAGESEPRLFIVECTNGMAHSALGQVNAEMQDLGTHVPVEAFTIRARQGLVHHVDYPTAMDLARRFSLPLYRTSVQTAENRISYDEAMRLQSQTDDVQVTVRVFVGDHFNLREGIYTPARTGVAIRG